MRNDTLTPAEELKLRSARRSWKSPELLRMDAGRAEVGDLANPDAGINS